MLVAGACSGDVMIEDMFPTSSVLSDEFLRPSFYSLHRDVIDQVVAIIGETLRLKKVT